MVSGETSEIPKKEEGENYGNGEINRNRFACENLEEWFDMKGTVFGVRDLHVAEGCSDESDDFVDNLFEHNAFFHEDNFVDQGMAMHDSNFQAWTQASNLHM